MTINTRQKRLYLLFALCILVLSACASHDKESNESLALKKDEEPRNEEVATEMLKEDGILASTSENAETTPQARQDVNSAQQASNDIDHIEDFPFLRDTNPEWQMEADKTDDFQQVFESDHVSPKLPKYKDRFVPLHVWKEEAIQRIGKSRMFDSPTMPNGPRDKIPGADSALDSARAEAVDAPPSASLDGTPPSSTSPQDSIDIPPNSSEEKEEQKGATHTAPQADPKEQSTTDSNSKDEIIAIEGEDNLTIVGTIVQDAKQLETLHRPSTPTEDASVSLTPLKASNPSEESPVYGNNSSTSIPEENTSVDFLTPNTGHGENLASVQPSKDNDRASSDHTPSHHPNETLNNATNDDAIVRNVSTPHSSPCLPSNSSTSKPPTNVSSIASNASTPSASPSPDASPTPISSSSSTSSTSSSAPPRKPKNKNRVNYASHDCGAKVLASNDEAVDASSVLFGSKDRYMLNPCSAPRQWIVLELCEEVGIDEIRIGNFEFFSSMIKDVQILASHHYPTTVWTLLGNFTLSNERVLQSLDFGEDSEISPEWFKYIKIRVFSHWGKEYYCPITEIQVHGLPYVEKLQRDLQSNEDLMILETFLKPDEQLTQTAATTPTTSTQQHTAKSAGSGASSTTGAQGKDVKNTKVPRDSNLEQLMNLGTDTVHQTDVVMPMHEYLEKHKDKASERINKIYDKSFPATGSAVPSPSDSSSSTPQSSSEQAGHPSNGAVPLITYDDVVHPGIPPPKPKIGGDDDLDEVDEDDENLKDERKESREPRMGKSTLPTVQLIQVLISRVKALEMNVSLVSGYLSNVSAFHQEELSELGEALNILTNRYAVLLNYLRNSSVNHASLETKVNSLLVQMRTTGDFRETVFSTLRMYLLFSALVSIGICLACSFLVVIILRCLPPPERTKTDGASFGLEKSPSEILLRSTSSLISIKEDPIIDVYAQHMPLSAPTTPPPHSDSTDMVKLEENETPSAVPNSVFVASHVRRHSEPSNFNTRDIRN